MNDLGMVPFVRQFPRQGTAETRTLILRGHPGVPDDEYGLLELYCVDADCHCRRVMLNVVGRWQRAIRATVSYGFDRDGENAGLFLDPLNPQSPYAEILLELVEQILDDPSYVARLEAHYYQVKGAVADAAHPCHKLLANAAAGNPRRLPRGQTRKSPRRGR